MPSVVDVRTTPTSTRSQSTPPAGQAQAEQAPRTLAADARLARGEDPDLVLPGAIRELAADMYAKSHPEDGRTFYLHKYGEAVHPAPRTGGPRDLGRIKLKENQLRLCILGDSGTGTVDQQDVAIGLQNTVKRQKSHAVLHMGDALYDNGLKHVEDRKFDELLVHYYGGIERPVYLSLGNHEYGDSKGSGSVEALLARANSGEGHHVNLPSRYYSFGYELRDGTQIDFFVLDTSVLASEPEQLKWLHERLSNSEARHKVVFGHHPLHSYGLHGDQEHLQKLLLPLLDRYASTYLCGHEHDQQVLASDKGLPLVVTGTAGETRETHGGPRSHHHNSSLGFATLHVDATHMDLSIRDHDGNKLYGERWSPRELRPALRRGRHPRLQAAESRI